MMDALLRDDRLRWDLAQLAATLDQLLPDGLGDRFRFRATSRSGSKARSSRWPAPGARRARGPARRCRRRPDDLDGDRSRTTSASCSATTRRATSTRSTTSPRHSSRPATPSATGDRLELTPRGSRRIGQKVLDDLFGRLRKDAFGGHRLDRRGRGGERDETTKPYEFGDPFHLDLQRTLATRSSAGERARRRARRRPGHAPRPDDFEVFRTEQLTRSATVLLVDMSRSMLLRGCFIAAKKVAIALDTLIRTQFPRDHLSVIGFAYYAREIRPERARRAVLARLRIRHEPAARADARPADPRPRGTAANKEIVVITDGEPTAHFEDGQVEFCYPPTRRTIRRRCAR